MVYRQPYVHDLTGVFAAPLQAWSEPHGQIRGHGAQGVYLGDDRVLARCLLTVNGQEPEWMSTQSRSAGRADFISFLRTAAEGTDPLVTLNRSRTVQGGRLGEALTFTSALQDELELQVRIDLVADAIPLEQVRAGAAGEAGSVAPGEARWSWRAGTRAVLTAEGAEADFDGSLVRLAWTALLKPGTVVVLSWSIDYDDAGAPLTAASAPVLRTPSVTGDSRLQRLMSRSLTDLNSLRMAGRDAPADVFLAAGAPWFLTLYGRESLVAARLLLPIDSAVAEGTLRSVARWQGTVESEETGEQPGLMVQEVRQRRLSMAVDAVVRELPPVIYGSPDATLLWIVLLHDAWHSGMPEDAVRDLLPQLDAALDWLRRHSDPGGDGFIRMPVPPLQGPGHQGVGDTRGAYRHLDGSAATGIVAPADLQAYGYEAARAASVLLDYFGEADAGDEWRDYASRLATNFRNRFWCADDAGPYPAMALDDRDRQVAGVGSGMGHLLGTGLLDAEETRTVAGRLMDRTLFTGYGIRTLSTANPGYWPTRRRAGAVWSQDTAWIVMGLLRTGFQAEAAQLAAGLLDAAEGFDYRLPELFSGQAALEVRPPLPYPSACRPHAGAAAAAVPVALALGGFRASAL
ncbi:glycogen debranching N-terminal domain-containing protein [Arthrobacter sp. NPDC055138]